MSMARGMIVLALALTRVCSEVEVQSDGLCKLGDDMCHTSPRALIQKHSRIIRHLGALDSVASEQSPVVSTADGIENGNGKVDAKRVVGFANPQDVAVDQDLAAEYEHLVQKCCWQEMKPFVIKVIHELDFEVCNTGGLMGLLWWFDCKTDNHTYTDLVEAIVRHGPDGSTGHKGDCPFIGWPGCQNFPTNRNCTNMSGPPPECKEDTTTTSPAVATTLTTTTMCTDDWNSDDFAKCEFSGDPHFWATFWHGDFDKRWDFQGRGIYQLASTKDGSFEMQSFQCKVENPKAAVALALAIKMDDNTHYFIHGLSAEKEDQFDRWTDQAAQTDLEKYKYQLNNANQCVKMSLGTKKRKSKNGNEPKPPWAHRVSLLMHKDIYADKGLCEVKEGHEVVDGFGLFTQVQIQTVCAVCTNDPPPICSNVLLQGNQSGQIVETGEQGFFNNNDTVYELAELNATCANATPPIPLDKAWSECGACPGYKLQDACVFDYCTMDGDKAAAEMICDERNIFLPGCKRPGDTCSGEGECCAHMTCDHSVCKYPEPTTCSQPKSNADLCMPRPLGGFRVYATNSSSEDMWCKERFVIYNQELDSLFFETNSRDECADLCDITQGCIGFDWKSARQKSINDNLPSGTWVHRCRMCQEVLGMCPALEPTLSTGQVKYYHRTTSGCDVDCKESGDSCSSQLDCCDDMVCDNSVCKKPTVVNCSFAKDDEDECITGHKYATNDGKKNKRCNEEFMIPANTTGGYFETDSLDECATLCDHETHCIGFDFKNRTQPSDADSSIRKYRCSLCKQVEAACPTLKNGQYIHFHLTYSGC